MKGIMTDETTGEVRIKNRRMVIGDVSMDVAHRILVAHPGEFKGAPKLGCNLQQILNGAPDPFWRGDAKKQLRSVGLEVDIRYTDTDVNISIKN